MEPIPPDVARKLAVRIGHGQEAVAVGSRSGLIEWTNLAWERITGWALERSVSKPITRLLGEIGIEQDVLDFIQSHYLAGRRSAVELPLETPDGRSLWIHLEVEPYRDETGEISDFVAVATDITDRRLAEQALERHFERQDSSAPGGGPAFAGEPSADLAVLAAEGVAVARELQALADRFEAEPDFEERSAVALVRELRERVAPLLARAENALVRPKPTHIPELVAKCCRELRPRLPLQSSIDLALSSKTPRAQADSPALEEVLQGIMSESVEAMDGSWSTLSVTAGLTEPGYALASEVYHASFFGTLGDTAPRVFIEIHDTAANIPPGDLARVAGELLPVPIAGRVFALMRARLRLEEMGAELHVTGAPGCGTRVLVLLPVAN